MDIFYCFIFFLIGLLSSFYSIFFLFLALIPFSFLFFYKKEKKKSILFLMFLIIGFLSYFLFPKGEENITVLEGIVVEKKESYCIVLSLKGKYYLKGKDLPSLFSIVRFNGNSSLLSFSHSESSFDFKSYLNGKGVNYQFYYKDQENIFESRFSLSGIKDYFQKYLNSESKIVFSFFIFDSYSSIYSLKELEVVSFFSLSGFHISLLIESVFLFAKRKSREKYYNIIKAFILLTFLVFSSFSFSMRRIFLSFVINLINKKRKNRLSSLNRLSLVALLMLLFQPYSISSMSFYYSFPFLFYLSIFTKRKTGIKERIKQSVISILFFLPYTFIKGYISLFSLVFQFIFIPYSFFIFFSSVVLVIFPFFGYVYNHLVSFLLFLTETINKINVFISVKNFLFLSIAFYYFIFLSISILSIYNYQKEKKIYSFLLTVPIIINFSFSFIKKDELIFVDVDQGDCTLLKYKNYNILFDTGGKTYQDLARESLIPFFRKEGVHKIDYVFISHLDYDHYGALVSLQTNFKVGQVFYKNDFLKEKDYIISVSDLNIRNLNIYSISEDTNDNSCVYYFKVKGRKILIQGDAPKAIEKKIIEDNDDLDCDIIKLGHHGSKTSSDKEYLKCVSPELAIISVGENNSYHLPSDEVISLLKELDIPYSRTDLQGTIRITL